MKLDKSKPYGEVYGDCSFNYTQNGKFFNAKGEQVNADGKPMKPSTSKIKPAE